MGDYEILETDIGGVKIKDLSAIDFMGWLSKKLNGTNANTPEVAELRMLIAAPIIGRRYDDFGKIKAIKKLINLGIEIK